MKNILILVGSIGVLCGIAFQPGCETQSAEDNNLRVEPHAVGLRVNESQEFTASGGFNYTWRLSDPSLGVLTRSDGPVTTYINRFNAATNSEAVVQHLIVVSDVGGNRTTSTINPDGSTNDTRFTSGFTDTAEAIIEHLTTH